MNLISQNNRFRDISNLFSKLFLLVLIYIFIFILPLTSVQSKEILNVLPKNENSDLSIVSPIHSFTVLNIPRFDPYEFTKGEQDSDNDGLSDAEERLYGTSPYNCDSDWDGLYDGAEVYIYFTKPANPDSDKDYIADSWEIFLFNTNPMIADMDHDGLNDGLEVLRFNTDPKSSDTDNDFLCDYDEVRIHFTDPLNQDSDQDGILDGMEIHTFNTNPLSGDTDGDSLSDFWEINNNHNPLRKDDFDRYIGIYTLIPSVVTILVLISLFASVDIKLNLPLRLWSSTQKNYSNQLKQIQLLNLLSNVPENQSYNIKELALITDESVDTIKQLLSSIFDDLDSNEKLEFNLENITIQSHTKKTYFEYSCFYCSNPIDNTLPNCPFCSEVIVRCRECKRPINNDDSYASCTSYQTIGKPNDISGYIIIELICESCLLQRRFNSI
ncbi:MAG: hypothetical protein JXA54_02225 [Candidatus Heimdallarchaeota archaeon]|nr:hypothetical protein [Candidatus Heimdallarchaeota archaeon]